MRIAICCTKNEYDAMHELSRHSTCRSFSEYARKVLLKKPVIITHRDLSLDSLIDAINAIRHELERLLDHQSLGHADIAKIMVLVQEIKDTINKIADRCILK